MKTVKDTEPLLRRSNLLYGIQIPEQQESRYGLLSTGGEDVGRRRFPGERYGTREVKNRKQDSS